MTKSNMKTTVRPLNKSDLKSGHVVELNNGGLYIVMINEFDEGKDYLFNPCTAGHLNLHTYHEDLTFIRKDKGYNVTKVYQPLYMSSLKQINSPCFRSKEAKLVMDRVEECCFVLENASGVAETSSDLTPITHVLLGISKAEESTELSNYITRTYGGSGIELYSGKVKELLIAEYYTSIGLKVHTFANRTEAEKFLAEGKV